MSVITAAPHRPEIEYPESDGKPMAETDVHIQAMIDTRETLADFFRADADIYVGANMLLYYEEGDPGASVALDVFVVKGIPKGQRRTYKLWVEGRPPTVVLEISSRSTRLEDMGNKRALYALLGVREYYLYDPLAEYLDPPLQGFVLGRREYEPMEPEGDGSLVSQALGLRLQVEEERLRLMDAATGERLLRPAEVFEQARTVEQRLAERDAEVAQLRAELARLRSEAPPGEARRQSS